MERSFGGPLGQGNVEAEFAELSGQASGEARSPGALKVIGPKIVIRRPALQHGVDRRQHGGRHGHNRLAGAPTRFEPLKQRMQVASLDARRTPGALHQDSLEPGSAGPEPGGAALARTLVVLRVWTWTPAHPAPDETGEMFWTRMRAALFKRRAALVVGFGEDDRPSSRIGATLD